AEAILAAIKAMDLHPGVFSLIQGGDRKVGAALVQHPLIKAVGFTGSLAGGRALFDLCAQRDEPIPFFGELGSVNPMFLLPAAMAARGAGIAQGWSGSLTLGAGQFCTNPGIAVVREDQAAALADATLAALKAVGSQVMLTEGIAGAYVRGRDQMAAATGVQSLLTQVCDRRNALPQLFQVKGSDWLANHALSEEVFGPLGLIVTATGEEEMLAIARSLQGQLTSTIHMDDGDKPTARKLLPILERKAGRVIVNGYPTGVEVCEAMVHGGPYPASTNFGATSVGTMSIRRFLRPVSFQNLPVDLLPADLR
ncbi:MAG: aldehyde dehydrogenase family protein, partial [Paracoccaceae bacterium]|nr:aldehyde dehydrogenase family protein [Paracoccaceae bacterium]